MPVCVPSAFEVSAKLSGKAVLVAEDEAIIAVDLAVLLESAGAQVVGPISKVSEALSVAGTRHLDFAILDIKLYGEFVWPVATVLRERRVPFLFLTGYSEQRNGFQGAMWLKKPFRAETLVNLVGCCLNGGNSPASRNLHG